MTGGIGRSFALLLLAALPCAPVVAQAGDAAHEDAAQGDAGAEVSEAVYQHDLTVFKLSYRTRKALGDNVCGVFFGFITQTGQVEQVKGEMIQVREQVAGTTGMTTHSTDVYGNDVIHESAGTPGYDHLEWMRYDKVGLCRFGFTKTIVTHECNTATRFASLGKWQPKAWCDTMGDWAHRLMRQ